MLGLYVHIPYCIQRCHYCDFTTFEQSRILPPEEYIKALCTEIKRQLPLLTHKNFDTIYFGGGTPSLLKPSLINKVLETLSLAGGDWNDSVEITIEINPATIDEEKLRLYLQMGINRFSVGAQSFDDSLLKLCGREHSAQDTRNTLELLKNRDLNYSFDLLFALPGQGLDKLNDDLKEISIYEPNHLSAYCLTLPSNHFMEQNRPSEEIQKKMFQQIEERLLEKNLHKYEISNFAKVGFESRHNLLYWTNQTYLGVGLSAHSYLPEKKLRFWNEKKMQDYIQRNTIEETTETIYCTPRFEQLKRHEELTDFCHTALRLRQGISLVAAQQLFGPKNFSMLEQKISSLKASMLLEEQDGFWRLLPKGEMLSNQVFLSLTFLNGDICP